MNERSALAFIQTAEQFGPLVEPEVLFDVTSALFFCAEVFTFGSSLGIDAVPHLAAHYIDESDVADSLLEFDCHDVRI